MNEITVTFFPGESIVVETNTEEGETLASALDRVGRELGGRQVRVGGENVDPEVHVPQEGEKVLVADQPTGNQ